MPEYTEKINNYNTLVNGKILYYSFLAGANQLLQHQVEINRINVFPVNDKDTGTNLATTIPSVLDNIKPHKSYKTTVNDIAEAALVGARANSGVIFGQFLYGLSYETKNKAEINITEFEESVYRSVPYIYRAISNTVEGTMLTVIKEWSEFLNTKKENIHNFENNLQNKGKVLCYGFWKYTRHPNYWGDLAVWWSYGIFSKAAGSYWQALGSAIMTLLIIKVSGVALLEKALNNTKPQYAEYMKIRILFSPGFLKNEYSWN